jgi:hypothetical protein
MVFLLAIGSLAFTAEPMGLGANRAVRAAFAAEGGRGVGTGLGGSGGGIGGGGGGGGDAPRSLPLIEPMLVCMTAGLFARNFPGSGLPRRVAAARRAKRRGSPRADTAGGERGAGVARGAWRQAGGVTGEKDTAEGTDGGARGEGDAEGRDGRARAALTKLYTTRCRRCENSPGPNKGPGLRK